MITPDLISPRLFAAMVGVSFVLIGLILLVARRRIAYFFGHQNPFSPRSFRRDFPVQGVVAMGGFIIFWESS